ncbi:hypothetical protein D3C85_968940 [compost metagenome]
MQAEAGAVHANLAEHAELGEQLDLQAAAASELQHQAVGHQGVVPVPGLDGPWRLRTARGEHGRGTFAFGRRRHHREDLGTGIEARQLPQRQPGAGGGRGHFPGQVRAPGLEGAQAGFAKAAHPLRVHAHLGEEIEVERYGLPDLLRPPFADLPSSNLRVLGVGDEGMNFHCELPVGCYVFRAWPGRQAPFGARRRSAGISGKRLRGRRRRS